MSTPMGPGDSMAVDKPLIHPALNQKNCKIPNNVYEYPTCLFVWGEVGRG